MRPLRPCLRLLCPRLAWCLSLLLLVGLSACGPAPSDHAPSLEPRASLGGLSESQTALRNSPSSHNDPVKPAASLAPFASNQKIERHNWDVAHEAEPLEDEEAEPLEDGKEQEETPGEREER